MNVTDVKFRAVKEKDDKLLGFASVTLDDELVITGIRVLMGKYGPFLSFPSREGRDEEGKKKFFDIAFPTKKGLREKLTEAVLKEGDLIKKSYSNNESSSSSGGNDDFWQ